MKRSDIAILFAGQGSQKTGMGKDLYQHYEAARIIFDHPGIDPQIKNMCFEGPKEKLDDTRYAQSAIFLFSMAMAEVLSTHDIVGQMTAGLSLGEYSALTYAKAWSISDAMDIINHRSIVMSEALKNQDTGMSAVLGLDLVTIRDICKEASTYGICEIANINCPGQIVISGHKKALSYVKEACKKHQAQRVIDLGVSGAFHCCLLEEAASSFKAFLDTMVIKQPVIPVISNRTGKPHTNDISSLLVQQMTSTVLFEDSIRWMIKQGVKCFIEIGPIPTLNGFVRKIAPDIETVSVYDVVSVDKLLAMMEE